MGTISFGSEGIKLYENEAALKANDCIIVELDWLADAGIALAGIPDPAAFVAAAREVVEAFGEARHLDEVAYRLNTDAMVEGWDNDPTGALAVSQVLWLCQRRGTKQTRQGGKQRQPFGGWRRRDVENKLYEALAEKDAEIARLLKLVQEKDERLGYVEPLLARRYSLHDELRAAFGGNSADDGDKQVRDAIAGVTALRERIALLERQVAALCSTEAD